MKKIIFITNSFPFGLAEKSFITPEFNVLKEKFDITIVSRNAKDVQTTECAENISIYRYDSQDKYNAFKLFLLSMIRKELYVEWSRCILRKKNDKRNMIKILKMMMRSIHFSEFLKKVRGAISNNSVIFYTYWNDYATYACTKVKNKSDKIISRIHGADLYLERSNGYQMYKHVMNSRIDALHFISKEGLEYYKKNYGNDVRRMSVSYLGVKKSNNLIKVNDSDELNLLSVSSCLEVKRLDLLIEALSTIKDIKVRWIHIGDGPEYERLRKKADNLLKNNIQFEFKGHMKNSDIIPYIVCQSFDFLINVSYSEGLPVTMMEAMSCGLPVIAGDVGGISEIVESEKNGYLFPKNIDSLTLGEFIKKCAELSVEEKGKLSAHAYRTWESKFCDEKNFAKFIKEIEEI